MSIKNKYYKVAQQEKEKAAYQYSKANGVSQYEAAKAVDYAYAKGISPKDVTPKSQISSTAIGNSLANCSTSSTSSTSNTSTNSSSSSTSSSDSISSLLSSDNIKTLFTELLNILKNIFSPSQNNMMNPYGANPYGINRPYNGNPIFGNAYNQRYAKMNPNQYAQQYATANNITLEKAKEQLKSMYGAPQQNAATFSSEC